MKRIYLHELTPEELCRMFGDVMAKEFEKFNSKKPTIPEEELWGRARAAKYLQISLPLLDRLCRGPDAILRSYRICGTRQIRLKKHEVQNALQLVISIKHKRQQPT